MSLTKASYSMVTGAPYNVLDYGADATGATDSTSTIQAAITAANAAGGGEVFFPKGTYKVGSTTALTLYSKVFLRGEGNASIIKLANSSTISSVSAMISAVGRDKCTVSNLYFDGNRANQTVLIGLFRVESSTNFIFHSNWFVNCNNVCIYFTNATSYCNVEGNEFIDSNGTNVKFGTNTTDCTVTNNLMYDTGTFSAHADGFIMSRFGTNRRLTITGNTFSSPSGSGIGMAIWLLCGDSAVITNNTFELGNVPALLSNAESDISDIVFVGNICSGAPIDITDKTPGFNLTRWNISENSFNTINQSAISVVPTYAGVFSNFSVCGNQISATMDGAADKGITIKATGSVVSNNVISMTGIAAGDGISNAAENMVFSGNLINMGAVGSRGIVSTTDYVSAIGNTIIGTTSYGIRMTAPANYCNVTGNTLRSCTLSILNGGANSVTANNIT